MSQVTEVQLSEKQERVLEQVASGATYPLIAKRLGISERTVRAYVDLLRRKFSVDGAPIPTGRALIPIANEWLDAAEAEAEYE